MSIYRHNLPQMAGKVCITDGGLETDLCFNHQIELPEFAAYNLLKDEKGYSTLFEYYKSYAKLANRYQLGLLLETPTWRANSDWGQKLGDSPSALNALNLKSVKLLEQIRQEYDCQKSPIIISGCLGPRGDGYTPENTMSAKEAEHYHYQQIQSFAQSSVDMIAALTINYVEEAIGITLAAQELQLPVCISFTVETDGNLPTGETLLSAIQQVDQATDNGPVYYMINCAHPTHFEHLFENEIAGTSRIKGIRCNASCLSHAELDESEVLHDGNPKEFGFQLKSLKNQAQSLSVLGGCCGTDHRHIEEVCRQLS